MKKLFAFLLLAFPLTLGGCIYYNGIPQKKDGPTPTPTPTPDPDNPDDPTVKDVTTYLVLSPVGLYKNQKGTNIASKFIENAVKYVAKPGTDLPGKEDVTCTTSGVDFVSWLCYEGTGAPVEYTKVPNESGKILYASFETTGETPEGDGDTEDTYVFNLNTKLENGDGNWQNDDAVIFAYLWDSTNDLYNESIKLERVSDSYYSFEFDKEESYDHVLFVRMPAGSSEMNWDTKWNQTIDLQIDFSYREAQIISWESSEEGKCDVRWMR